MKFFAEKDRLHTTSYILIFILFDEALKYSDVHKFWLCLDKR
jgi:hypothetical protein